MQLPIIHTNGTSARNLTEGYADARIAIEAAIEQLSKVEFNARDYYPAGPETWNQARKENQARFDAMRKVAAELYAIEEHCCNYLT